MRIKSIRATAVPPVEHFEVEGVSDLVVIAGPNGVGKSRLVSGLLSELQQPKGSNISFLVESTSQEEEQKWKKRVLDTTSVQDRQLLLATLQENRTRRLFKSGVLYYESNRAITNLKPLVYSWEFADPWTENIPWNATFGGLSNRFQDTIHALFKKVQAQKSSIAAAAINLKKQGHKSMNLDFGDPLDPFRDVFSRLLGPKTLEDLDVRSQKLMYSLGSGKLSTESLSSGEKEVLNIAFDFILRRPSDCVIFFDEPELHLHPELSFNLISTLRSVGERNQFILCSHSPDLISSSLNDTVICLTPPRNGGNQAVVIDSTSETSATLSKLGQSIGIIALGKRIVLVEGDDNSLDKKVYSQLTRARFPNLVVLPASGKNQIASFGTTVSGLLEKAIWGIDFFLLCDRDAVPFGSDAEQQILQHSKVRLLGRYHLENYFLDSAVIAEAFRSLEAEHSWLRSPMEIETRLQSIAVEILPYATSLITSRKMRLEVGNVDVMAKGCHGQTVNGVSDLVWSKAAAEKQRVDMALTEERVRRVTKESFEALSESLKDGSWKVLLPGKQIVTRFCSLAGINYGRFVNMYLAVCEKNDFEPLRDIVSIFEQFAKCEDAEQGAQPDAHASGADAG